LSHTDYVYEFIWAFRSNYVPVVYHFRDKAIYRSKIAIFHTPCAFDAPVRESILVGILPQVSSVRKKTRIVWVPDGEKKFENMTKRSHTVDLTNVADSGRPYIPRLCIPWGGKNGRTSSTVAYLAHSSKIMRF